MSAPENPWIEWNGGKCPVPPNTRVEVVLRQGKVIDQPRPQWMRWTKGGLRGEGEGVGDIVRYRVVQS